MTVIVSPDTEAAVKAWLKTALTTAGGRVFFAIPEGSPVLPLVTVSEIVTLVDKSAPVEGVRITHRCWARNKADANEVRRELVSILQTIHGAQLAAGTLCHYVTDISSTWLPDDDAKLASYVVDATYLVTV